MLVIFLSLDVISMKTYSPALSVVVEWCNNRIKASVSSYVMAGHETVHMSAENTRYRLEKVYF